MDNIISVEQAAGILGVQPRQVRHLAAKGDLPATRLGRAWLIRREDAERFQRQPPGPKKNVSTRTKNITKD